VATVRPLRYREDLAVTRQYSAEERVEAVGLAMSVGPVRAARQLGLPVRTVTNWTHSRQAAALRIGTQDLLKERLREAVAVGVEVVLTGFRDPKARLGDKAAALRVVAEQYALLTGAPTSHSVTITAEMSAAEYQERWQQDHDAAAFLRTLEGLDDAEMAEWLAANPEAVAEVRDQYRQLKAGDPPTQAQDALGGEIPHG
jgi:hypothetical protein